MSHLRCSAESSAAEGSSLKGWIGEPLQIQWPGAHGGVRIQAECVGLSSAVCWVLLGEGRNEGEEGSGEVLLGRLKGSSRA